MNTPARGVGKASIDSVLAFATEHAVSASEAFERAGEIEGLSAQVVADYRALRDALDCSEPAEAGQHLVFRLGRFLEAIGCRDEVTRLYSDPLTREARWGSVVECSTSAGTTWAAPPSRRHGFLEELASRAARAPEDRTETLKDVEVRPRASPRESPGVTLAGRKLPVDKGVATY